MKYTVGQILFVIIPAQSTVVPVQIIEEITKKTLEGSEVSYIVRYGANDQQIDIKDVDGEIYVSPSAALATLVDRSTTMMKKIVRGAVTKAEKWYGYVEQAAPGSEEDPAAIPQRKRGTDGRFVPDEAADVTDMGDENARVMLPDGRIAKLKLPPELS